MKTPIVYICFNRPVHVARTLASIVDLCGEDDGRMVYVYQDGEKSCGDEDHRAVSLSITAFAARMPDRMAIRRRPGNVGLRKNITDAVGEVLQSHAAVIVLEDDVLINRMTLEWFDAALEKYKKEKAVYSIQGYSPPGAISGDAAVFLPGADSWGWATWADRWSNYCDDIEALAQRLEGRDDRRYFNHGSQANWEQTLRLTRRNRRNSWAVRWRASVFLKGGLSLYPSHPMVVNIGHDGSGEHCTISDTYACDLPISAPRLPDVVASDGRAKANLDAWHARNNSLMIRIRRRLKTMIVKWMRA